MAMSKEHKQALAEGRRQSRVVRDYLQALESSAGTPGRSSDPAQVQGKVDDYQRRIDQEPSPVKRVELIQKRLDAEAHLATLQTQPDVEELERQFVEIAADYSDRKGISYTAWREQGVPAAVLRAAGVPRTRRSAVS